MGSYETLRQWVPSDGREVVKRPRKDLCRPPIPAASLGRYRSPGKSARTSTATHLPAEIIAIVDGLQVQWLLNPDQVDMTTVFLDYINRIRRSI
jgi:hypothetical protein